MRLLIDITAHNLRLPGLEPRSHRILHSFNGVPAGLFELRQFGGIDLGRDASYKGIPLLYKLIKLWVGLDDSIAAAGRLREVFLRVGEDIHVDMPMI